MQGTRKRSTQGRLTLAARVMLGAAALGFGADQAHAGERLLRVMSYNIHGMIIVKNDHGRYAKIGRILAARRAAGDAPEIVAIQEALHKRTKELWREAGYPYVLRGPMGHGFRIGSGLGYLSEYPLTESGRIVYDDCMDVDCLARKGAHRARVEVPGVPFPIELTNTHMQATYSGKKFPGPESTRAARGRQLSDLLRFILAGPTDAVSLFTGDFNFRPESDEYARFTRESGAANGAFLCIERPDECDGAAETGDGVLRYIDHVFVRSGAGAEARPISYRRTFRGVDGAEPLSDHLAVESTWRLRW